IRRNRILGETTDFSEPGHHFVTTLYAGDTVVENVRYSKVSGNTYRRSVFYYVRKPTLVEGQYFAYSIMCSKTGKLLAYHSKDRLGSRLNCLLKNRTPNGSSLAKPLLNALSFDLEVFKPYSRWTDALPVTDKVPWSRTIQYQNGKPVGVVFDNSAVRGRGYPVHNSGRKFEGCQHVFDLLATSNNILSAEIIYRLNRKLYDGGDIAQGAFPLVNYFYRVGALNRVRDDLRLSSVTGVRVLKELYRIPGAPVDSMMQGSKKIAVSDSLYSVALGTLEVSLYEQMHLFNTLYNNDLIERPADRNSLAIESIELNGVPVPLNDTLRLYHPFADVNNLRPTLLGLHKRLAGKYDGLNDYDVSAAGVDLSDPVYESERFDPDAYYLDAPLSNFAKSGTTDDILRPFNVDASSKKRTNYCMWNAVLRVDLSKLPGGAVKNAKGAGADIRDITVASIGEGNQQYTGPRDGKSLHKFLTTGLLKSAGVRAPNGYFAQYESYLQRVTPLAENCGEEISQPEVPISVIDDADILD
ncbi:MAG: hypothetical protein LBH93_06405, partial [Chitinispirillales bacterium]|nr:hypothetical protein [Chitinispirillales bacterium]